MHTRGRTESHCHLLRWALLSLIFAGCVLISGPSVAQNDSAPKRKIVNRTAAAYPPLARTMALSGAVRIEAVVSPDGSVKAVDIKGGHPVLAQAAANTVRQWKWEAAARESHELIEIRFTPPE